MCFPLSDTDRFFETSQRILHKEPLFFFDQEKADGRFIIRVSQQIVNGGKIHIQLAHKVWFEGHGFQFDNHLAT